MQLPPFCYMTEITSSIFLFKRIMLFHLTVVLLMYGCVFGASLYEECFYITGGIGILQNPPFWSHLFSTTFSIPALLLTIQRVSKVVEKSSDQKLKTITINQLRINRFKSFLFKALLLTVLFAVANNIVMAFSYDVKIYDSPSYPLVFCMYSLMRIYIYCSYLLMISGIIAVIVSYFNGLQISKIEFLPFHHDKLGGFREYYKAVDYPVYIVHLIIVVICVANYIGWGGFTIVSTTLSIISLVLVTLIAALVNIMFYFVISSKKKTETIRLIDHQTSLYKMIINKQYQQVKNALGDIVKEIEATNELLKLINNRSNFAVVKYFINLAPIVIISLDKWGKALSVLGIK